MKGDESYCLFFLTIFNKTTLYLALMKMTPRPMCPTKDSTYVDSPCWKSASPHLCISNDIFLQNLLLHWPRISPALMDPLRFSYPLLSFPTLASRRNICLLLNSHAKAHLSLYQLHTASCICSATLHSLLATTLCPAPSLSDKVHQFQKNRNYDLSCFIYFPGLVWCLAYCRFPQLFAGLTSN